MTRVFRIKREAVDKMFPARRWVWFFAAIPALGIISFLFLIWDHIHFSDLIWLVPPLLVGPAILLFSSYLTKKLHKSWATFALHVSSDSILRTQEGYPDLEIRREEFGHMHNWYFPWKALIISGKNRYKVIMVPAGIEGFDELLELLRDWKPLQSVTEQRLQTIAPVVGALLALAAHYLPQWAPNSDPRLLLIAHALSAVSFIVGFVEMRRNPYMDKLNRRFAWLMLLIAGTQVWSCIKLLRTP